MVALVHAMLQSAMAQVTWINVYGVQIPTVMPVLEVQIPSPQHLPLNHLQINVLELVLRAVNHILKLVKMEVHVFATPQHVTEQAA